MNQKRLSGILAQVRNNVISRLRSNKSTETVKGLEEEKCFIMN